MNCFRINLLSCLKEDSELKLLNHNFISCALPYFLMSLFFCFLGVNMRWDANFFLQDAAFVTPVCPRLVFGNAVPTYRVKYCIQPLRDRTF